MGRRVLVTGLSTFWGGRVAQQLEADPDVEVIIGLDRHEPKVKLERTEYVRSDENYSILSRIVQATKVDTIWSASGIHSPETPLFGKTLSMHEECYFDPW